MATISFINNVCSTFSDLDHEGGRHVEGVAEDFLGKACLSTSGALIMTDGRPDNWHDWDAEACAWVKNTRRELVSSITALELQITPRRLRDAILGMDNGWLANIESQIEAIRRQL